MKQILIIEDDPAISIGLKQLFEIECYSVLTSDDGESGLNLAIDSLPDLIILDLNLPKLGGIDVCKTLREKGYNGSIIILTSKAEQVDKIIGLEIGADDYVTKPFNNRELLARARANIRKNEMLKQSVKTLHEKRIGENFERKLLTIMFTDMENYSKKMHEDEQHAIELLSVHNDIISSKIKFFSGRVIEIIGDAFLASFKSAVDAIECAVSIQTEFKNRNLKVSSSESICVRIGVHLGEVLEFEDHIKGDTINIASRIQEKAVVGSIFFSQSVYDVIKKRVKYRIDLKDRVSLKNINDAIQLYKIDLSSTVSNKNNLEINEQ